MKVEVRINLRSRKGFRGIYGYEYREGATRRVVVNLDFHNRIRRDSHRSVAWMVRELIATLDHEIAHAFFTQDIPPRTAKGRVEENFTRIFERAGAWARR